MNKCNVCGNKNNLTHFPNNMSLCINCWDNCLNDIKNPTTEQITNWIKNEPNPESFNK